MREFILILATILPLFTKAQNNSIECIQEYTKGVLKKDGYIQNYTLFSKLSSKELENIIHYLFTKENNCPFTPQDSILVKKHVELYFYNQTKLNLNGYKFIENIDSLISEGNQIKHYLSINPAQQLGTNNFYFFVIKISNVFYNEQGEIEVKQHFESIVTAKLRKNGKWKFKTTDIEPYSTRPRNSH